jgi:hypothetical protein
MSWLNFINAAWLSGVIIIQLGWIDQLPELWPKPNLILVIMIIWLVVRGWHKIKFWLLALVIILEYLSIYPFGSQLLLWLITVILVNLLLVNFLTNKSFYSFSGLIIIGTIIQWLGLIALANNWSAPNLLIRMGGQLLANWLAMVVFYYGLYWLDKRLNPLFLWKNN